jgi:hypothetical protein
MINLLTNLFVLETQYVRKRGTKNFSYCCSTCSAYLCRPYHSFCGLLNTGPDFFVYQNDFGLRMMGLDRCLGQC